MRIIILILMTSFTFAGCRKGSDFPEVTFEWFNLSTNQIWITAAIGLPDEVSPGRLMPSRAEDQLEASTSTFSEVVHVKDRITIKWKDNGKEGWPGGIKTPGGVPPGVAHQVDFKRDDLGLPAKLENVQIRFTYLGNDKWRITRLK